MSKKASFANTLDRYTKFQWELKCTEKYNKHISAGENTAEDNLPEFLSGDYLNRFSLIDTTVRQGSWIVTPSTRK